MLSQNEVTITDQYAAQRPEKPAIRSVTYQFRTAVRQKQFGRHG